MSLQTLLVTAVTVIRQAQGAGRDEYNDPVETETARTDYQGWLEQTDTQEIVVGRDTVVSGWLLILPEYAVIGPHDRVESGGRSFEVVGEPNVAQRPSGPHHLEVRLRLIEG